MPSYCLSSFTKILNTKCTCPSSVFGHVYWASKSRRTMKPLWGAASLIQSFYVVLCSYIFNRFILFCIATYCSVFLDPKLFDTTRCNMSNGTTLIIVIIKGTELLADILHILQSFRSKSSTRGQ